MSRVYKKKFITDSIVYEWCQKFKDSRTDVHDEGGQGHKSVTTDYLVQRVDEVVRDNCRFTISALSMEFPEVSKSSLYFIVMERHRKILRSLFTGTTNALIVKVIMLKNNHKCT